MLKIIKYGCVLHIPKSCIATIDASYDGVRLILNDRTEMSFQMTVTQQLKALLPIVRGSTGNMTLNLDNAIAGKYDCVLSMTMPEIPPASFPMIEDKKEKNTLNVKKVKSPTKKVGRPAKKKNT
jgi:hypothetical protein